VESRKSYHIAFSTQSGLCQNSFGFGLPHSAVRVPIPIIGYGTVTNISPLRLRPPAPALCFGHIPLLLSPETMTMRGVSFIFIIFSRSLAAFRTSCDSHLNQTTCHHFSYLFSIDVLRYIIIGPLRPSCLFPLQVAFVKNVNSCPVTVALLLVTNHIGLPTYVGRWHSFCLHPLPPSAFRIYTSFRLLLSFPSFYAYGSSHQLLASPGPGTQKRIPSPPNHYHYTFGSRRNLSAPVSFPYLLELGCFRFHHNSILLCRKQDSSLVLQFPSSGLLCRRLF